MGKRAQPHPFENNPFLEGFADWMDSPEGELSGQVSDTVWELLENADLDARNRKIIWQDGTALDIDQCVQRIHQLSPDLPAPLIETHVLSWLECGFAPQGWSQERLDQLDSLIERWLRDYQRQRRKR